MDRETLEREARLLALELAVARILAILTKEASDEMFEAIAEGWIGGADDAILPNLPADDALLARMALGDELHKMLRLVRETRAQLHGS